MPLRLQGILLVYDITSSWSFDGIDRWIKEIDEVVHSPDPLLATPIPDTWADIPTCKGASGAPTCEVPPTPRFCGSPSAGCYGTVGWGSGPQGPTSARNRWRAGPWAGGRGLGVDAEGGILPLRLC